MAQDLTTSQIDRQNVLNNPYALQAIQNNLDIKFLNFKGTLYVTKQMAAGYYEVDERTIERTLKANEEELAFNGYRILQGNELKDFKLQFDGDIDVGIKTVRLGIFDFRSFLNLGMLLTTSEKAKQLRSMMLDIVIATINEKTGGGTKFINWRDRDFLPAAIKEEDYHKKFTSAIKKCVTGNATAKYGQITNMIYKAVFCEHAEEYRILLKLNPTDNVRRTLYTEVLRVVSSFENAVAHRMEKLYEEEERKLALSEVQRIINEIAQDPMQEPYIYEARQKMASRDNAFRQVTHEELLGYMKALDPEEFDRFIGEHSIDISKLLDTEENREYLGTLN